MPRLRCRRSKVAGGAAPGSYRCRGESRLTDVAGLRASAEGAEDRAGAKDRWWVARSAAAESRARARRGRVREGGLAASRLIEALLGDILRSRYAGGVVPAARPARAARVASVAAPRAARRMITIVVRSVRPPGNSGK
ncbi:hypothetical protein ACSSS7_001397 [Eimeria intestinalis]